MNWSEVIDHPQLKDLPFKIELNEWGQIVLSPANNRHGRHQGALASRLFAAAPPGEVITECSIQTSKGVKVADVAWASTAFLKAHGFETPYSTAPELCVEIASASNSGRELREKATLYFQAGAEEVWLCSQAGQLAFFTPKGKVKASRLFPSISPRI